MMFGPERLGVSLPDAGPAGDSCLPQEWTEADRGHYLARFRHLASVWHEQPFDVYHRPFSLPTVIPDLRYLAWLPPEPKTMREFIMAVSPPPHVPADGLQP
jgi:hypothetical protein